MNNIEHSVEVYFINILDNRIPLSQTNSFSICDCCRVFKGKAHHDKDPSLLLKPCLWCEELLQQECFTHYPLLMIERQENCEELDEHGCQDHDRSPGMIGMPALAYHLPTGGRCLLVPGMHLPVDRNDEQHRDT